MQHRSLLALTLAAVFAPQLAHAQVFARADDTRVAAPEQRKPHKTYGLDLSLGGSYLSGNVDHVAIAPAIKLDVRLDRHQFFGDAKSNYAAFSGDAVIDRHKASVMYAYAVAEHWNAFAYNTHAKNAFITLDYRTTASAGICFHSFLGKGVVPLVSAGVTPEFEWWQDGTQEQALRGTLRAATSADLNPHIKVGFDLMVHPSVTQASDYRVYGEGFAQLKITDNALALRISVTNEYDSQPKMDIGKNDFTVIPSLVVKTGD